MSHSICLEEPIWYEPRTQPRAMQRMFEQHEDEEGIINDLLLPSSQLPYILA
jgi:hypothetical protein